MNRSIFHLRKSRPIVYTRNKTRKKNRRTTHLTIAKIVSVQKCLLLITLLRTLVSYTDKTGENRI